MTVKELKEKLEHLNDEHIVILSDGIDVSKIGRIEFGCNSVLIIQEADLIHYD